ncbi:MAG TPA: vWA domain-containing protein [Gaiellaceae bacterium]|nr:vWA domain-containing protein [Gaiellaceae bacterium]
MTSRAIPIPDVRVFGPSASRTQLLRAGLGLALVGTLVAAFLAAPRSRPSEALLPGGTSPVVVLDMSWSTSSDYRAIGSTIRELASSGRRVGLVVFSDVAYEAFPPGTPASELRPLLRFFSGPKSRRAASPWASSLSGGTRISGALDLARSILARDRIANGSVVLVSDLGDAPNDSTQLSAAVLAYVHEGIPLRVVGIDPTAANEQFFRRLLGSKPLRPHGGSSANVTPSSGDGLPIALLVLAACFLALLAVNEVALARLSWGATR